MIIPSPLDTLLQHLADKGIRYANDERRNRYLALFPYPESAVWLIIEDLEGAIGLFATLPVRYGAVEPVRRPAVSELLHRTNIMTPRFVWLFDYDTGDVFCRTVIPTEPHTPSEPDYEHLLSRLAIVLPAIIPSILAVAFDGTPPTEAAFKAELSLFATITRARTEAGTPAHHQPSTQN